MRDEFLESLVLVLISEYFFCLKIFCLADVGCRWLFGVIGHKWGSEDMGGLGGVLVIHG